MSQRTNHNLSALCAILASMLGGAAPTAHAAEDWPMFRGNPRQTGVATSSLPEKLDLVWRVDLKEPILSTAALVDGAVYVGTDDGTFLALNLSDGNERWRVKFEEGIRSSPTVLKTKVSEQESEISNLKSEMSDPQPDGAKGRDEWSVYFGDQEGKLRCLSAAAGKERWAFSTAGEVISSVNHADGRIVFGSYDGFIYCLDAARGLLHWKFETAGRVHGTPAIVNDAVIAAGCDEFLHVISLADGASRQKVSMGSVSGASAPVEGPVTVIGTYGNSVLGVNWKEAKVIWTFTDPERQFPFMSSAAITSTAAFVGGRDKRLRSLDPSSGKVNWTFATDGKVESSPVVVGNRVFFGSADGNLYAVDADSGSELWRYEAGGPISASPAVAAGKLVIGTEDGVLYCFGNK